MEFSAATVKLPNNTTGGRSQDTHTRYRQKYEHKPFLFYVCRHEVRAVEKFETSAVEMQSDVCIRLKWILIYDHTSKRGALNWILRISRSVASPSEINYNYIVSKYLR
jgi:hypothetical protein